MSIDKRKNIDMTEGEPSKLLLTFAIPILFGNIFQLLYNMADSIIVGRFVSADALAAVGTCTSPFGMFVSLNMGAATGVGILVAQFFGAHKENKIQALVINSLLIMSITSVILGVIGVLLAPKILVLLGAPQEVLTDAITYLRIIFLGLLGSSFYNMEAGVLRSLGDSKMPLYFLVFSSILNTILDILCVTVFHLGVLGVGLATVISQYVVAVVTFYFARKKYSYFRFGLRDIRLDGSLTGKILKAGVPLALQNSTISLSNVFLQRFVNSFGATVMAAHTVAMKFDNINNMPLGATMMALSTFTGQNIGAKKMDRIKKAYRVLWLFAIGFSAVMFAFGHLGGRAFMSLFSTDEAVIEYGVIAIGIYSGFVLFLSNIYINRAVINGSGDTRYSMFGGFMEVLGRVGFALLLIYVFKMGMRGIWYACVANWGTTGVYYLARYLSGKWKEKAFT